MLTDMWVSVTDEKQIIPDFSNINIIIPSGLFSGVERFKEYKSVYISLPHVIRNRNRDKLTALIKDAEFGDNIKGYIVNNIEGLMLLKEYKTRKEIVIGAGLYIWNKETLKVFSKEAGSFIYPYELSRYEIKDIKDSRGILMVYGRTPLMVTANCIRKTMNSCRAGKGERYGLLKDRKGMNLPVLFDCEYCYNIIYNAHVTSLHEFVGQGIDKEDRILISFTDESPETVKTIFYFYRNIIEGKDMTFPGKEFTKAYFNHGVE